MNMAQYILWAQRAFSYIPIYFRSKYKTLVMSKVAFNFMVFRATLNLLRLYFFFSFVQMWL